MNKQAIKSYLESKDTDFRQTRWKALSKEEQALVNEIYTTNGGNTIALFECSTVEETRMVETEYQKCIESRRKEAGV